MRGSTGRHCSGRRSKADAWGAARPIAGQVGAPPPLLQIGSRVPRPAIRLVKWRAASLLNATTLRNGAAYEDRSHQHPRRRPGQGSGFLSSRSGLPAQTRHPDGPVPLAHPHLPNDPNGVELLLERDAHPAAKTYKAALKADGIPATSFAVRDIQAEYTRLCAGGVQFTQPPTPMGPVTVAVFDDTCGNLIQIAQRH